MSFTTVLGWLYAPFFLSVATLSSAAAIVLGHRARSHARRAGHSAGSALLAIVAGWLGLAACAGAVLLSLGVLVGLAALTR